jgi:hypothetical protein
MTSSTDSGLKTGTDVVSPPTDGTARIPPSEAAWSLMQVHELLGHAPSRRYLVYVEHEGPVVEDDALGETGRPAGVHEDGDVVLVPLLRHFRVPGPDQVLVLEVVGRVALTDEYDLVEAGLFAHRVDRTGEPTVDEADLAAGIGEDERQLLGRQSEIERVDDAAAQEAGVVQLEVLVTVERHHAVPVTGPDTQLGLHAISQPANTVQMLGVGRAESSVYDGRLLGQALDRRQEVAVVYEFLQRSRPPQRDRMSRVPGIIRRRSGSVGGGANALGLKVRPPGARRGRERR